MPIVLSAASLRQRAHRRAQATRSSSSFSWAIFFIAVFTFTVWSLGASTCTTQAEHQQLLQYYRTEATFCKSFASVLLLLQQLSENLQHILPAVVTALLFSHSGLLHPPSDHSSSVADIEGGAHKAELVRATSVGQLLRLLFVWVIGGQQSAEEGAAASASS